MTIRSNLKLFFACGTALLLLPLFSHPAQAKEENLSDFHHEDLQHENLHHEGAEIVSDLLTPHTTQFTAHENASFPRVVLRCDQLARYEYGYEQNTDWENYSHHESSHESSHESRRRSVMREILRSYPSSSLGSRADGHSLTIEIEGQCDDIHLQVEPPVTISLPPLPLPYPNSGQAPSVEQYLEWYEEQIAEENIPWIVRPGSGWHWLLRDR